MISKKSSNGSEVRPLMLGALAIVWFWTAFVSLGPGHDWGMRIMAETGASPELSYWAIVVGAGIDALLGLGLMFGTLRSSVLKAQIALMIGYTLLITVLAPHYWLDPFASVAKNLVLIVATFWLIRTEPQR